MRSGCGRAGRTGPSSRKRSSCSSSCRRKPAAAPISCSRRRSCRRSTSRSRKSCQPVQPGVLVEEPDAQRRLAPRRRPGDQAGSDRAHAPGLLRAGIRPVGVMHLVPLVFYAAAAAAYLDPLRVARSARRAAGDGDPRRRRARPHVPHRHADRAGRARAARRHDRGDLGVRLAARPVVSLRRADDRRAGDGRVRGAADRRART